METRRNLESVYKRRLDESEKKRFLTELHLFVLKQYILVTPPATSSTSSISTQKEKISENIQKIELLLETLKNTFISQTDEDSFNGIRLWEDSSKIAKLRLDELSYLPTSIFIESLGESVHQYLQIDRNQITYSVDKNTCVSTDVGTMIRIFKALHLVFSSFAIQLNVNFIHSDSILSIEITDSIFSVLNVKYDAAITITNSGIVPLDELTINLFIAIALAQSLGGDLEKIFVNEKNTGFRIVIPCDIVDSSQCTPIWDKQSSQKLPILDIPLPPAPPPTPEPEIVHEQPRLQPIQDIHPSPILEMPVPIPIPIPNPAETSSLPVPAVPEKVIKTKLNILLVEDGNITREVFKRWWSKQGGGHNVFVASNGQEAIDMYKSDREFNIIFTDIEMPIKDGLALAREIRAYEYDKKRQRIPIIGVSGYQTKSYRELALEAGMDEFVSKGQGYQFNEIYKIVVKYCGEPV